MAIVAGGPGRAARTIGVPSGASLERDALSDAVIVFALPQVYFSVRGAEVLQTLAAGAALPVPHTYTSVAMAARSAGTTRLTCWIPAKPGAGPA